MKKILILSYHFEPMNVIASQRAIGYANHFKKFGFEPTVITQQWDKKINDQFCKPEEITEKSVYETNENYSVYKLPIGQFKRGKLLKRIENSPLNKISILFSWVFGHLDTKGELLNCFLTERYFLKQHLKKNSYDIILGIFSPHYHLKNCSWANKKFKLPYILDYRDFWNNRITRLNYKPNKTERIQDYFCSYWWRKWAKKALFQTKTSQNWADKLQLITKNKTFRITNGFEKKLESVQTNSISSKFNILSIGTIYPQQDLTILLKGISNFIIQVDSSKVSVLFVGMEKQNVDTTNSKKLITEYLNNFSFQITKRISKDEVLEYEKMSSVLIFPTIPNEPGFYSGKIFEYISSNKPVLAAPKDMEAVGDLINLTNTGICSSDVNEITEYLLNEYNFWAINGYTVSNWNRNEVANFSRENQTKILSDLINH